MDRIWKDRDGRKAVWSEGQTLGDNPQPAKIRRMEKSFICLKLKISGENKDKASSGRT